MMVCQSFNDVSALTSTPSRCNSLNSMYYYYSAPASPSRVIIDASFDFEESEPRDDDFEFETSRKFHHLDHDFEFEKSPNFEYSVMVEDELNYQDHQERGRHRGEESLPSMAFADELFCNGRVVPLKLPPRLRAGDHDNNYKENKSGHSSPRSSSPASSSVLKLSFPRRSLWNDDFDPFTTALKNVVVREEKIRGRSHDNNNCRRARSQSPLRNILLPLHHWSIESKITHPLEPSPILVLNDEPIHQTNIIGSSQQVGLSSYELAKPKGLGIARKLRPLKLGHERPILKTGERVTQETKGLLLFRSASMDRECSEHNNNNNKQGEEDQRSLWKAQKMRSSFSFNKSLGEAHSNGKKRVAREMMKSIIHYRPKLFLCMGFGFKAPRK